MRYGQPALQPSAVQSFGENSGTALRIYAKENSILGPISGFGLRVKSSDVASRYIGEDLVASYLLYRHTIGGTAEKSTTSPSRVATYHGVHRRRLSAFLVVCRNIFRLLTSVLGRSHQR